MRLLDKPSYYEDILERCSRGESLKSIADFYEVQKIRIDVDLKNAENLIRQGKIRLHKKQRVSDMPKDLSEFYDSLIEYVKKPDYVEPPQRNPLPGFDAVHRFHPSYYELLLHHFARGATTKSLTEKYGINPVTITMDLSKAFSLAKEGVIRLSDRFYFGREGSQKNLYEELALRVDKEGRVRKENEEENANSVVKDYDQKRLLDKLSYYEDILARYGRGELIVSMEEVYNIRRRTIQEDMFNAASLVRENTIRLLEKKRTDFRARKHDHLYDELIKHVSDPKYVEPPEREPLPALDSVVRSENNSYYDLILRYGARGANLKFLAEKYGAKPRDIENDFGVALLLVKKGQLRLVEKRYFGKNKIHGEIYEELVRQTNKAECGIGDLTPQEENFNKDFVQKRLIDKASYYEDVLKLCGQGKTAQDLASIYQISVGKITRDLSQAGTFVQQDKIRLHEKQWVGVREEKFLPVYKELVMHVTAPDYVEPLGKEPLPDLDAIVRSKENSYYESLLRYKARGMKWAVFSTKFGVAYQIIEADFAHALRLVQCGVVRMIEKDYFGINNSLGCMYQQLVSQANEEGYIPATLKEEEVRRERDSPKKKKIAEEKKIDVSYYEGILQMRAQGEKTAWIAKSYFKNASTMTSDMRYALSLAEEGKIRILEEGYCGRSDKFKQTYLAIVAKNKAMAQETDAVVLGETDYALRPE